MRLSPTFDPAGNSVGMLADRVTIVSAAATVSGPSSALPRATLPIVT